MTNNISCQRAPLLSDGQESLPINTQEASSIHLYIYILHVFMYTFCQMLYTTHSHHPDQILSPFSLSVTLGVVFVCIKSLYLTGLLK